MTAKRRFRLFHAGLALLLAAVLCISVVLALTFRDRPGQASFGTVGLFTSLPILWPEARNLSGLLDGDMPPHWALPVLKGAGRLVPLDTLAGQDGKLPLPRRALLILAQPQPLSPAENVALDDWVRAGGRVLLFADPMLTGPTAFAPGDPRRRQDIAMLSPILGRWGLELQFDADQPAGQHDVSALGTRLPVNLPGHLVLAPRSSCRIEEEGLAARCRIGAGEVLCIADAALLENGTSGETASLRSALARILRGFSS